jgi:hypothetical protein
VSASGKNIKYLAYLAALAHLAYDGQEQIVDLVLIPTKFFMQKPEK